MLLLLFISSLLSIVQTFSCPLGSDQVPRENVCIIGVSQPVNYIDAIRQCGAYGGMPAKITNVFENSFIFSLLSSATSGVAPYIGLEKKDNNTWLYADGTPVVYINWATGEPKVKAEDPLSYICAFMDPLNGQWRTSECYPQRPFFCSLDGDDFQCPNGWIYNRNTDYCYLLRNFTYPTTVSWSIYDQDDAENLCVVAGGKKAHLVSIHSKEEDKFVYDMIYSNVANFKISNPCYYQKSWTGYSGRGKIGSGSWTDGSPVDYVGKLTSDGTYSWTMVNDPSCKYDPQWIGAPDSNQYARFVCKMPTVNRMAREDFARKHGKTIPDEKH